MRERERHGSWKKRGPFGDGSMRVTRASAP
jgi:hypothetical protein